MKLSYYQEATLRASRLAAQRGDTTGALVAKDQDAISVSMAMAEVARQLREDQVSPHIVDVYCEADISNLPLKFQPLLTERVHRLSRRQIKHSHVCIMELYNCNLTTFLCTCASDTVLRALLFQVLYTLACLQAVLPGFRHNDLSTNNVLIKKHQAARELARAPEYATYVIHRTPFYIPNVGHTAALSDFDFTHVHGNPLLTNGRVLGGKYGITPDHNPAYDSHVLLHSVYVCLSRLPMAKAYYPHTMDFLKSVKLDHGQPRLKRYLPHLKPSRLLLHHPYFTSLTRARNGCTRTYVLPSE
jgi:hypothetical protein